MSDPKPAADLSESAAKARLRARGLPAAGDVIADKYALGEVLGRGAMGCVMSAEHLLMQRKVAIKFVLGFSSNPNATERFVREARVTQSLQDEHVVRVYDLGVLENGTPYLVMEYLEGQDLAQLLHANQRFPVDTSVDYVLGACEALAEAHAAGIVHRDVKPSNLILTQRKNGTPLIKVVDFGISKVLDDDEEVEKSLTGSVAMLGSPLYMSPEQIRSAKTIDARADVWALGVTLYTCLTGQAPFDGEGVHGVCASIVADPPRPFPKDLDLPAGLEQVLSRCLAKRPEERTASVVELAAELSQFASKRGKLSADRINTLYNAPSPESSQTWQPKLQKETTLDAEGSQNGAGAAVSAPKGTEFEHAGATLNHPTSQTIDAPLHAKRRPRYWIPALVALGLLAAGAAIGRLSGGGGAAAAPVAPPSASPTETPKQLSGHASESVPAGTALQETHHEQQAEAENSKSATTSGPEPLARQAATSGSAPFNAPRPQPKGLLRAPETSASSKQPEPSPAASASAEPASRATDDDGFPIPD